MRDDEAAAILGVTEPRLLGEGMEGAVYEIDAFRVAKIWYDGSAEGLRRTAAFYAALELPFAVPSILEIRQSGAHVVTVERRLHGTTRRDPGDVEQVLAALIEAGAGAGAGAEDGAGAFAEAAELPMLGEPPTTLGRLAERRLERFRPVLAREVERLDEKAAALLARLPEVDSGRRAVIHGDLVPQNILVDDAGRVSAVLDWGFLTTVGDPAFDAAVAAAVFDMYGPGAAAAERDLTRRFEERFGYTHEAMLVYRAAYSLITANAYDPQGNDGHFAWCVAGLNRADITRTLLG